MKTRLILKQWAFCCNYYSIILDNLLNASLSKKIPISLYETIKKLFPEKHLIFILFFRGSTGLPLVVQVVGRPWQEETVLAVMRDLEIRREDQYVLYWNTFKAVCVLRKNRTWAIELCFYPFKEILPYINHFYKKKNEKAFERLSLQGFINDI